MIRPQTYFSGRWLSPTEKLELLSELVTEWCDEPKFLNARLIWGWHYMSTLWMLDYYRRSLPEPGKVRPPPSLRIIWQYRPGISKRLVISRRQCELLSVRQRMEQRLIFALWCRDGDYYDVLCRIGRHWITPQKGSEAHIISKFWMAYICGRHDAAAYMDRGENILTSRIASLAMSLYMILGLSSHVGSHGFAVWYSMMICTSFPLEPHHYAMLSHTYTRQTLWEILFEGLMKISITITSIVITYFGRRH